MLKFAETCERIAATTKKLEKVAIVGDYFRAVSPDEASVAAVFLSGRPFPVWEETTLQVGGSLLWRIVQELSGKSEVELTAAYRRLGDLGAVAGEVLQNRVGTGDLARPGQSAPEVQSHFRKIASAHGPRRKVCAR